MRAWLRQLRYHFGLRTGPLGAIGQLVRQGCLEARERDALACLIEALDRHGHRREARMLRHSLTASRLLAAETESIDGAGIAPAHARDHLAAANAARDSGDVVRAARHYAAVLKVWPGRHDLRVQLGNMLKDGGRLAEAEAVYRELLDSGIDAAEIHLQLAHTLKLAGRAAEAVEAYAQAFARDPDNTHIQHELAALGDMMGQAHLIDAMQDGRIADGAAGLALQLEGLAGEIARLRAALPDAARTAAVPLSLYHHLRRRMPVAAPPTETAPISFRLLIETDGLPIDGLHRLLHSLQAQTVGVWQASFHGSAPDHRAAVERASTADPRFGWADDEALDTGDEWTVVLQGAIHLDPHALAWLGHAITVGVATALWTDEERIDSAGDGDRPCDPLLRGVPDPDLLLSTGCGAALVAVRTTALAAAPPGRPMQRARAALFVAATVGEAGLVPLPLVVRNGAGATDSMEARRQWLTAAGWASPDITPSIRFPGIAELHWPVPATASISVIIPTRDNGPDVATFIDSLRRLASRPERLEIIVIDNGSRSAKTRDLLHRLAETRQASVHRIDEPFNWSRLNNLAAKSASGDMLLFANDDMAMLSPAWDDRLAGQLARPGIGAVGAKIIYPDGRVQHAGMLLGYRGLTIHDGLGAGAAEPGPASRWIAPRRVGAVTGAFLGMTKVRFMAAGGFDAEGLAVAFGDVDYALRLRELGFAILYDPAIELLHIESKSRGADWRSAEKQARFDAEARLMRARWGDWLDTDPGRNPHWSDYGQPFTMLTTPSRELLLRHIARSVSGEPWRVDRDRRKQP